jgi:hypothetical protein
MAGSVDIGGIIAGLAWVAARVLDFVEPLSLDPFDAVPLAPAAADARERGVRTTFFLS